MDTDAENTANMRLKALRAAVPDLPATAAVRTPGKGGNRAVHLYYSCPEGEEVRNSVKKLPAVPGVDVRGVGGYVVGPGSIIDGREYRGEPGFSLSEHPIARATPALLALCRARAATAPGDRARKSPPPCCELDTPRAIEHARQWLRDSAPEAVQGAGGRDATKLVIQRLGDFGLSADGTFELLTEDDGWNETKADPPWAVDADDSEGFRRRIDDLFAFHREKPAGCAFPWEAAEVFEAPEIESEGLRERARRAEKTLSNGGRSRGLGDRQRRRRDH